MHEEILELVSEIFNGLANTERGKNAVDNLNDTLNQVVDMNQE